MTRYTQPAADRLALLARALRTTADLLGLEADGAENPEVMRALVTSAELTVRSISALVWRLEGQQSRAKRADVCGGRTLVENIAGIIVYREADGVRSYRMRCERCGDETTRATAPQVVGVCQRHCAGCPAAEAGA